MYYLYLIICFLFGLIAITLIDTVGAIESRKQGFKYSRLSYISFCVYILLAVLVSRKYNISIMLFTNAVLGLYDGTIGFWFSIYLKANNGMTEEQSKEMLGVKSAIMMIIISAVCGIVGYGIAGV